MQVSYKNSKVEQQCTNLKIAKKNFPEKTAKKLLKLINLIETVDNLRELQAFPQYHFHNLKGEFQGYYALDIDGRRSSYRLIVSFDEVENEQIFINSIEITDIRIEEVSKHYE